MLVLLLLLCVIADVLLLLQVCRRAERSVVPLVRGETVDPEVGEVVCACVCSVWCVCMMCMYVGRGGVLCVHVLCVHAA